jgi:hypothetical protein
VKRVARLLDFGGRPPVIAGLAVGGIALAVMIGLETAAGHPLVAYDAHAYWSAAALDDPYRETIEGGFGGAGGLYEYKYPPPLAQALWVVHWVPWPVFATGWTLLLLVVAFGLTSRLALLALIFPPLLGELWLGNINLLLALAIVVGFRWPAAWAFVLLTKVTPGVGLLWFLVRREWRNLAIALGATAIIGALSFLLAPGLWADFVASTRTQLDVAQSSAGQAIPLSLPFRMAVAAALVVAGAWTDRRWFVPIAVIVAIPFSWWNVLVIGLAVVPLVLPAATPALAWAAASNTSRSLASLPSGQIDSPR